jgi:hypothetical protein
MMREDWIEVELGELTENPKNDIVDGPFGSNLKSDEYVDIGIPVFKIQNIKANRFVDKNIHYVTPQKSEELKRHTFKKGDLIITKLGDPLGLCCKVPEKYEFGVIVADLIRFRSSDRIVFDKYLIYGINSILIQKQFKEITKGTTRPRVNLTIVRSLKFPLAPLPEQRAIAAKIEQLFSELDNGIANLKTAKSKLEIYRQAILKQAFEGELTKDWRKKQPKNHGNHVNQKNYSTDNLPETWKWAKLGEVAEAIDPQPSHRTPPIFPDGVPYVGIGDIDKNSGLFNFSKARKVSPNILKEHIERYELEKGNFVIGKIGTIGKPFKIPEERFYTWLYRSNYARLISKCQQIRDRNLKLSKFLKPYPDRLISFSLLLIPSTTPLVVRFSK